MDAIRYTIVLVGTILFQEAFVFVSGLKSCDVSGTQFECKVSLPQENDKNPDLKHCNDARRNESLQQRLYYKMTNPKDADEDNPTNEIRFPQLDQTPMDMLMKASLSKEEAKWFSIHSANTKLLNLTTAKLLPKVGNKQMNSYGDYQMVYESFLKTLESLPSPFFPQPIHSPTYTDIIKDEKWQQDKYFVQRKLAGLCPYFIRLVVDKSITERPKQGNIEVFHCYQTPVKHVEGDIMSAHKLLSMLNDTFNWDRYLKKQYGINLKRAIRNKRLFVLYHEEYNKLPQTQDILDMDPYDNIKLRPSPSPISIFIVNDKKELEIAAIQINDTKTSRVFTPDDTEYEWLQAKGSVEIVDVAVCQAVGHLLETHKTQELYCNIFHRHFGRLHPLHQIMEPHCEGTSPVGSFGPVLLDPGRFMHRLFNIGYIGPLILLNERYKSLTYEDADFELHLEKKGLLDSSMEYYPYRDDGKVIWTQIKSFARKYVKMYYKSNTDVQEDRELQAFANEMSADGDAEDGGKYKKFPAKFTKRIELVTFLTRFIWLTVKHMTTHYPLIPYAAYVPISPTKLYDNPEGEEKKEYLYHLPNGAVTLSANSLFFTLASFRMNRLFDYANVLDDIKARKLVKETYENLNTCIQKKLEKRNKMRFENEDLTYQYMEPKWLPNSIHN